ncbi:MAG TPA: twin-arginine translocase TatA/TatE family subunit [Myxococcaceae bacterium]|jgi:sec-independent protein translocase protein TatB
MLNLGAGEVILILVVALLVLGPKRLPELARGLGKFLREIRRQTDEVRSVVEREFYRMDQDLNSTPAQVEGDPQHHILPVQAPRPPAALMAEASRPTNPGGVSPATPPEAGAAGSPAGTVPSAHDRPTLVPTGSDPEGGA